MNLTYLLSATTTGTADPAAGMNWYPLLMLAVMFGLMFVMVYLPQKKQQKKEAEMRNSIEVGDGVTTIGGIVGRVVSVKEDTILMETGSDRVKIRMMKNAIASVEKLDLTSDKQEDKKA